MNAGKQFLLVVACVCCLFVVATALPSADPRIDTSGGVGWDPVVGSENNADNVTGITGDEERVSRNASSQLEVVVDGNLAPANEVTIRVTQTQLFDSETFETPIVVNGQRFEAQESVNYTVPFTESITVDVYEEGIEETFQVDTDADIETDEQLIRGREVNLTATVGSEPLPEATVQVDGEQVGTTDEEGNVTVALPEEGENASLGVERGPVGDRTTVDFADIDVEFTSLLVLPGLPGTVQVTADGAPVEGATVEVSGNTEETGEGGQASVWVPVSDAVTVTASAGTDQAADTVTGLYWRLTVIVLGVPSILVGVAVSYLRWTSRATRSRHEAVFFGLGSSLLGLFGLLGRLRWPSLGGRSSRRSGSLLSRFSFSLPSLSLPSLPLFSPSLPRLSGRMPSIGGITRLLPGRDRPGGQTAGGGSDDEAGAAGGAETPEDSDRSPEQQVGRRWHQFVAHLGIERPETWTPGQVARHALAAGYPGRQVRRLVATFRAIEYGGRDATTERVEQVRETTRSLLASDPEEEEK